MEPFVTTSTPAPPLERVQASPPVERVQASGPVPSPSPASLLLSSPASVPSSSPPSVPSSAPPSVTPYQQCLQASTLPSALACVDCATVAPSSQAVQGEPDSHDIPLYRQKEITEEQKKKLDEITEVVRREGRDLTKADVRKHKFLCPRCESQDTKFDYFNNKARKQVRYFCNSCRRHWTLGGAVMKAKARDKRRSKKKSNAVVKLPVDRDSLYQSLSATQLQPLSATQLQPMAATQLQPLAATPVQRQILLPDLNEPFPDYLE